jgi:hypothetical protein
VPGVDELRSAPRCIPPNLQFVSEISMTTQFITFTLETVFRARECERENSKKMCFKPLYKSIVPSTDFT